MTASIFLSYRRGISSGSAGRIFDLLQRDLPDARIFMDVDSIEPGVDFFQAIDQQILTCDYFIAVIGPGWADAQDPDGRRRLDDPNDYVRLEIEAALRREIRVVPVLVEGAKVPAAEDLPDSLRSFARRNAYEIGHHSFAGDVHDLCNKIKRSLGVDIETDGTKTAPAARLSWADILFSYQGRLSRGKFWIWNFVLAIVTVAIQLLIMTALGNSLFSPELTENTLKHQIVVQIASLPSWWSSFALAAKRMKDFNAGGIFLTSVILISTIVIVLYFAALAVSSQPTIDEHVRIVAATTGGIASGMLVFLCFIWIAIGSISGTPGQNRYGPDPKGR